MSVGERIYKVMDLFRKVVIVSCFSFVILTCFTDVILRYLPFFKTLGWSEEIVRSLNVWIIFMGTSIGVTRKAHFNVSFFLKYFGPKVGPQIVRAVHMVILAFLVIFIVFGTKKTIENIQQNVQAFPISIAWFYAAIPIGSFLIFLDYLLILIYGDHPFYKTEEEFEI